MAERLTDEARENMRDGFAEDMANHQRKLGQMPTPDDNQALTVPLFERLEKQIREDEHKAKPAPVEIDPNRERKAGQGWADDKGLKILTPNQLAPKAPVAELTGALAEFNKMLQRRVALLLTKKEKGPLGQPSWHDRVLAAALSNKVGYGGAAQELIEVCEASNEVFGDWKKEKDRPLWFNG